MGIDIENYRQRIGTFNPTGNKFKTRGQLNAKQFEFYFNQVTKCKRNKVKNWEIILSLGIYVTLYIFISGSLCQEDCFLPNKSLKNENISSVSSSLNGHFIRNENNINEMSKTEFSTEQLMETFQIPGYNIILPDSWTVHDKARIILYVNSELNIKVCSLENDEKQLQVITLEIGFGRSKKHFLSFYYREWKNMVTGLSDKKSQVDDLIKLTNIWRRYTDSDKDFVSLGDMNICAMRLEDESYAHSDLADILLEFLLAENCSQMVNEYTRIRSVNGVIQRSCLDHIISNCVSKMSHPEIHGIGKSDHLGISTIRSSKELRSSAQTTKKEFIKTLINLLFKMI